MRVRVQKWGNSLALRIPKPFAEDAAVTEGTVVELSVLKGRLVALPLKRKRHTLRRLIARVRRVNVHGEVDWGGAVGRESW
jgi:antitoxin MazE